MSLTPAIPTGAPVIQPPTFGSTFSACAPNDTPSAFATTEPLSHITSDSVPDEDTLRYGFQAAKNRYTDFVFYLAEGRQLRLDHSNTLAAQNALNEITDLDSKHEGECQSVASQIQWFHDHARNSLQTLILDYHWPTIDVYRDPHLTHDIINLILNPVSIASVPAGGDATSSHNSNNNDIAMIDALHRELATLKLHIQQEKPTTSTTAITNPIPTTNQHSIDHIYIERRRHTKLPSFSNGTAATAQQWIEKYTCLCGFLSFSKSERLDELNAFLQHFGGGTEPSRAALAELKLLCQGTTPMSQFAPKFVELLHHDEIFSDVLQLDYFSDCVHGKLQEAIYMRGASNLQEAINICIEVEYALARSGQTLPTYTPATPNSTNNTTITNNTELMPAEQNNQWNNNR
ncbi:hypothetical protein BDC45DRAFT_563425 [Circinella umbellata]|nr:hypothetical protein BDC45DRAFT_563425 [Circinella umbellata]